MSKQPSCLSWPQRGHQLPFCRAESKHKKWENILKNNMKVYRGGQGAAKRIQVRSRHTTAADTSTSPEGCAIPLSVSNKKNTHLSDTGNLVFPQLTWDQLQEPLCVFFLYVSKLQALYSLLQDVMESFQE